MMKKFLSLFFSASLALALGQQITLMENQPIYIEFQTQNKSANTSQFISVTEVQTKRRASVELTPTAQDKSVLTGYFRIQMNMDKYPSQQLEFQTKTGNKLFAFVLPNTNTAEKALSVVLFNTEKEWQAYSVQFLNKAGEDLKKKLQEVKSSKSMNAEQLQGKKETIVRLNDRIQEQSRLSFEAQEAIKREELLRQQQAQNEEAKLKAKADARNFAAKAEKEYRAGKFPAAAANFQKAYELDPENDAFLYKYGVALYKVGNYNKSLSVLSMAEEGNQDPVEHRYYVGLNHLRLNELDKALENFSDIQEDKHVELSPPAAYYAGTIEFQKALYPKAKERYQFVLDNSKDPKLDKQAEAKLEEIDRIESFLESQKEIFRYNLYTGLQYDGNVLNISTQNIATNADAYRLLYGASLAYYYFRTMKSKYAAELSISDMYSVDKNFKSDSTIQSADPLQYGIRLPINYSHSAFSRSFNSNVTPYMSMLNMSDDGGSRKLIMTSSGLGLDTQWDQGNDKFHIVKFDYAVDKSSLEVSSEDDNQSAKRMSLNYNWVKLLNPTGGKSFLADVGYVSNTADGKNYSYSKLLLSSTYSFPWSAKYRGSARVDYADQNYSKSTSGRKDTIYGVTLGASQDINKKNNISLTLSYLMNNSTVEAYKYNKVVLGFIYSFSGSYVRK
ncbi:MAG: tetratricopeptide repeat protein [Bdellovibrionaceae bacterium]|nr:tetratricopeptide repeat protein [Pseudobdellovibrionaceae bacterium]